MCFDSGAHPPIAPITGGAVGHRSFELTSADGVPVRAFEALAGEQPSEAAMLVLPDARGLHRYYEELALRFAESGIDAVAIDYFARTAGTEPRPDEFPYLEHLQETRWAHLSADIAAGVEVLARARPERRLYAMGFCFGGRLAFLCATWKEPQFAGVIGFYGQPVGAQRFGDTPPPVERVEDMHGNVLGLFGGADPGISAASIDAFDAALTRAALPHELHVYPDAPHSFFDRRADDFAAESADAWHRVLELVARG